MSVFTHVLLAIANVFFGTIFPLQSTHSTMLFLVLSHSQEKIHSQLHSGCALASYLVVATKEPQGVESKDTQTNRVYG